MQIHPAGRHSIVVVDDDSEVRGLVVDFLQTQTDFAVVGQAANGREAVGVAARERPDVVLMDVHMPVLDGLGALPMIQAACNDAVVVLMSGDDSRDTRQAAMALGAADLLAKDSGFTSRLVPRLRELLA